MKSVGEVMAIGRTFQESFQKALRGLETGTDGLNQMQAYADSEARTSLEVELREPGPNRVWFIADAFRLGYSVDQVGNLTGVDPWFLARSTIGGHGGRLAGKG